MNKKPLIIGHRGACGYAPENTLASFSKALEFGVDMIEFDVHLCKSGELVVIHDATVDRTTNGTGYVKNLTLSELQKLDAGNGEKVPTLQEVLALINRKCIVNIELKGPHTALPVAQVIQEYIQKNNWHYSDFLVSSFNHRQLAIVKQLDSQIPLGVLVRCVPVHYAQIAEELDAVAIIAYYQETENGFIQDSHKRGLNFYVWTVNEPNDIQEMFALGVDGIIGNYPDRILKELER